MVDPVRLARLLQRLGEQRAILRRRAAEDRAALRADEARLSGTKYRFVTAVEAVLDVAHHLLASELWGEVRGEQPRRYGRGKCPVAAGSGGAPPARRPSAPVACTGMDRVARVVERRGLGEPARDAAYWRSRPAAERIAMVEALRSRHHGWDDGSRPELQRVHRVASRA